MLEHASTDPNASQPSEDEGGADRFPGLRSTLPVSRELLARRVTATRRVGLAPAVDDLIIGVVREHCERRDFEALNHILCNFFDEPGWTADALLELTATIVRLAPPAARAYIAKSAAEMQVNALTMQRAFDKEDAEAAEAKALQALAEEVSADDRAPMPVRHAGLVADFQRAVAAATEFGICTSEVIHDLLDNVSWDSVRRAGALDGVISVLLSSQDDEAAVAIAEDVKTYEDGVQRDDMLFTLQRMRERDPDAFAAFRKVCELVHERQMSGDPVDIDALFADVARRANIDAAQEVA